MFLPPIFAQPEAYRTVYDLLAQAHTCLEQAGFDTLERAARDSFVQMADAYLREAQQRLGPTRT